MLAPKNLSEGPATLILNGFCRSLFLNTMAIIYLFAMFEIPIFKE
jgi:hypothetical protein